MTIGKNGLFTRVRKFDVTSITEERASQVLNLIGRCQREKAAFVSTGAETFYCWVSEVILLIGNKVRPGNPLYPPIHNRVVPKSTSVCLRSGSSSRPMATKTERFSNFVSVKY